MHSCLFTARPRLIPARAGNITDSSTDLVKNAAHPRSRGEHLRSNSTVKVTPGSSPLARGTSFEDRRQHRRRRLIPARAGNIHGGLVPG